MAKSMFINGQNVPFDQEKNLLEVIRKAGIELPTFCYYSELSIYGACRMCLVEEEKQGIMAACSDIPRDGYRILTHTPALQAQRKRTMELLLANHPRECTVCPRNADCKLRELSHKLGVEKIRFGNPAESKPVDSSSAAIIRDPNKCILCGDCVRMCEDLQGVGAIGFAYRGSEATVTTAFNKPLAEVDCIDCGQCAAVCPTGALQIKEQMDQAWAAIHDPGKLVVAQIAPAVKVAFGEAFGLQPGEVATGKIIAALKKIGFDQVYDTSFAADLTVIEESHEFSHRLEQKGILPLFTTCCPSWVKYAELHYPHLLDHLSTCRSPQQMFGALAKTYLQQQTEKDIFVVSIMPCTAKKFEAGRPEFSLDGQPQVDLVLTAQELIKMVRTAGIAFDELKEDIFNMPFGFATGSGNIFGATGGVTEAVLRNLSTDQVVFKKLRGTAGIKETRVEKDGRILKIAVIHGLGNAKTFLDRLDPKQEEYHLVEIMACPGGCIGGAGQPCPTDAKIRRKRGEGLYTIDRGMRLSPAKDNPFAAILYQLWLKEPGSAEALRHLHTDYRSRKRIQLAEMTFSAENPGTPPQPAQAAEISICVGTCCYTKGSYDLFQAFYHAIAEHKLEERVSLQATFCLENCQGSPCIKIGEKILGKVSLADVTDLLSESLAVKE